MANTPQNRLRVMLDANIFFAASIWPRFPYEVLRHSAAQDYQLIVSPYVLAEARRTIAKVDKKALTRLEIFLVASQYEAVANPTQAEIDDNLKLVRDVRDVPIALAAINAQVDYLVTQDKDLTDPAEPIHQKLNILLPGTFLREHLGWSSEALEAIRKRTWADMSQ